MMSIRFITSLDICGICDATTFAHDDLRVVQELCWTRGILLQLVKFWTLLFWTDSVGWTVLGMKVMVESVGLFLFHGKCWAIHILFWIFPH